MKTLSSRKLILAVSGGIAAYKSAELVRLLTKAGAQVHVVLTDAARQFIAPATFQALSGHFVWSDLWDPRMPNQMAHIDLSRDADAIIIAPATADVMARLATGQADDLLTTLCLARDCPLLLAPAMNRQMWEHPATQRNAAQLMNDGAHLFGPAAGEQACGETGFGRMLEPEVLSEAIEGFFVPKRLKGKRVVLTAGPTFEAIDPVRGISNISSGKMGYALARACAQAGAEVRLISGPTLLPCPYGVQRDEVHSAARMQARVFEQLEDCDIFIGVAAVADYRPLEVSAEKIKKKAETLTLTLTRNPDILASVAARPKAPLCVGFAAESCDLDRYAEQKRRDKNLQLVVGNLVVDSMGQDHNTVVLYDAQGRHPLPSASKQQVAHQIIAHLSTLLT